jgi:hypothetical protein
MTDWRKGQGARDARIRAGAKFAKGKIVEARAGAYAPLPPGVLKISGR